MQTHAANDSSAGVADKSLKNRGFGRPMLMIKAALFAAS
jgi:hypothetical protein